jgi:hypothetical protein
MSRIKSRDVELKTDLFEKKISFIYISRLKKREKETQTSSVDRMHWTNLHIPEEREKRKKRDDNKLKIHMLEKCSLTEGNTRIHPEERRI